MVGFLRLEGKGGRHLGPNSALPAATQSLVVICVVDYVVPKQATRNGCHEAVSSSQTVVTCWLHFLLS